METLIIKLAVAVIPLVVLIGSITLSTSLCRKHTQGGKASRCTRHTILRILAAGVMLR